jgi:hypothetical protein
MTKDKAENTALPFCMIGIFYYTFVFIHTRGLPILFIYEIINSRREGSRME